MRALIVKGARRAAQVPLADAMQADIVLGEEGGRLTVLKDRQAEVPHGAGREFIDALTRRPDVEVKTLRV